MTKDHAPMPVDVFEDGRAGEAAEALHLAVLVSALDAIITVDTEGLILEFNPAAERTFGYRQDEVVGKPLQDVVVPHHLRDAHRNGFARYLGTGEPRVLNRRIEVEAVRRDGTIFPAELAITQIRSEGPPMFTGHIRDITARKAAEEELKRSRARLVEAADAARRRLERDLHDGAQQRLVALGLDLNVIRQTLARDADKADAMLEEAMADLTEAIAELRDLARGIHPAILSERGLGAALNTLARRASVPTEILEAPDERFPAAVEATAYFVAAEALTNATRHSGATRAVVRARREGDDLLLEVVDDGCGGADVSSGSGLRGLADRAVALDGVVIVESPPGGGTRVLAKVPCGS